MIPDVSVIEVRTTSTIVEAVDDTGVVTNVENSSNVHVDNEKVMLIEVGLQGPAGPAGNGSGPETHYDQRSDVFSDSVVYRAEAAVGSLDDAPVWRIRRIDIIYGDAVTITNTYPDGDMSFNKRWTLRATYNYQGAV